MPSIPDHIRVDLVRKLIDILKAEPDSFLNNFDSARAKYVAGKEYDCGKWVLDDDKEPIQVVVVGEIGPRSQLGPYGEAAYNAEGRQAVSSIKQNIIYLKLTDSKPVDVKKLTKLKGRFNILFPPRIELDYVDGDSYKVSLKTFANNLNAIEMDNELRYGHSYDDSECLSSMLQLINLKFLHTQLTSQSIRSCVTLKFTREQRLLSHPTLFSRRTNLRARKEGRRDV